MLNWDGFYLPESNSATCGGVQTFRTTSLQAFRSSWEAAQFFKAILWGIIHGVKLAQARDFSIVLIKCDSKVAIGLLNKGYNKAHPCSPLMREFNLLIG